MPAVYSFNTVVQPGECQADGIGFIALIASPAIANEEVLSVEWRGTNRHLYNSWTGTQTSLNGIINNNTYTVTVTNQQGGVVYQETISIDEQGQQPLIEVSNASHVSNCNGNDGQFQLSISEGKRTTLSLIYLFSNRNAI